mmetsp:Transcript_19151/g.45684  ORF Transcript_19151/g.45684 Transcript_19151/m.45684 type:complete len:301 (-) Transcript_19151:41-943(-)
MRRHSHPSTASAILTLAPISSRSLRMFSPPRPMMPPARTDGTSSRKVTSTASRKPPSGDAGSGTGAGAGAGGAPNSEPCPNSGRVVGLLTRGLLRGGFSRRSLETRSMATRARDRGPTTWQTSSSSEPQAGTSSRPSTRTCAAVSCRSALILCPALPMMPPVCEAEISIRTVNVLSSSVAASPSFSTSRSSARWLGQRSSPDLSSELIRTTLSSQPTSASSILMFAPVSERTDCTKLPPFPMMLPVKAEGHKSLKTTSGDACLLPSPASLSPASAVFSGLFILAVSGDARMSSNSSISSS